MSYPPLVKHTTETQYREHFSQKYCVGPIFMYDGIPVRFYKKDFDHAFYESSSAIQSNKSLFSFKRAEKIDWIEATLLDKNASLHYGWDNKKRKANLTRRVAITNGNYIVVIQIMKSSNARFITAFPTQNYRTVLKISSNPKWQQP